MIIKRVVGSVNNTVTFSFCGTPNGMRRVQAELAVSFSTPNGVMSESNSLDQLSVSWSFIPHNLFLQLKIAILTRIPGPSEVRLETTVQWFLSSKNGSLRIKDLKEHRFGWKHWLYIKSDQQNLNIDVLKKTELYCRVSTVLFRKDAYHYNKYKGDQSCLQ